MIVRFTKKAKKYYDCIPKSYQGKIMNTLVADTASMLKELPVSEQKLAYEFVKRLVLAWDPDFTKVTSNEAIALQEAENEYENGEYVEYQL